MDQPVVIQPLRYVILYHSTLTEGHFDLMFETLPGSMLATWRSDRWPIEERTTLTRLRDHRRLYLDYQGDLSDHRGTVQRLAEGTCEVWVGENSAWTIRLASGASPVTLMLKQISGAQWEAEPN